MKKEYPIRIKDVDGLCILNDLMLYKGKLYENLSSDPENGHKWRFLITDDDYDYVTSKPLERALNKAWKSLEPKKVKRSRRGDNVPSFF